MADVLLHSYEPERTAVLSRIETRHDHAGRAQLELSLAVGVLGDPDEAAIDAEHLAATSIAALRRHPAPLVFDRVDAATLLDHAPRYCAAIRQRLIALADGEDEAQTLSRWDHPQLETWAELAELFVRHPAPLAMQAAFAASALSPAEIMQLEHNSRVAEQIRVRAVEEHNPVLARRAARMVETIADLAESYCGPLWVGGVAVGSSAPLPRPLLRSAANAISNELDVLHPGQAAPVVAARSRLVGGYEIECSATEAAETFRLGLPAAALRQRTLDELYSITEAALAFRHPVGRVPTLPIEGAPPIAPPADLPGDGVTLGHDAGGRPVFLGKSTGSQWLLGSTGAGKSTAILAAIKGCLEHGIPFVVLDPHGPLAKAARFAALSQDRDVALFDPAEPATLSLDLLDGLDVSTASDDEIAKVVGRAVVDAASSHLPHDWAGVRWHQLARAAGDIAVTARHELRYEDIGRLMIDEQFLAHVLDDHPRADSHSALVLRQLTREQDKAGTGLWASAKFDSIARSAIAKALFAPFGIGVSVRQLIDAEIPIVAALNDGSRVEVRLAGHIFLTSVLDYVFSREPQQRTPLYLFVDEASMFPSVALARAASEGRKFGLHVFAANQSTSQLDDELIGALEANAGRIVFRLGLRDAHLLAPLMGVTPDDLTSLANLQAIAQLPGHSAFTVRLDPPEPVLEMPPYEPPVEARRGRAVDALGQLSLLDPTRDGLDANGGAVARPAADESDDQFNVDALWAEVAATVRKELPAVADLLLHDVVDTYVAGRQFFIGVSSEFLREYIEEHCLDLIQAVVAAVRGRDDLEVRIRVVRQ